MIFFFSNSHLNWGKALVLIPGSSKSNFPPAPDFWLSSPAVESFCELIDFPNNLFADWVSSLLLLLQIKRNSICFELYVFPKENITINCPLSLEACMIVFPISLQLQIPLFNKKKYIDNLHAKECIWIFRSFNISLINI